MAMKTILTTAALLGMGLRLVEAGEAGYLKGAIRTTDTCPTCHGFGCGDCGNSGRFGLGLEHRTLTAKLLSEAEVVATTGETEAERRAHSVRGDDRELARRTREELVAEYTRHHRVSDTREMTRRDLRDGILRARHGQAALSAAFAPKRRAR